MYFNQLNFRAYVFEDKDPFLCRVLPTCKVLLSSFTIYISDNQTKLATLVSEYVVMVELRL